MAGLTILVIGATGFIGTAIGARLRAEGHRLVVVGRDPQRMRMLGAERAIELDLRKAAHPAAWVGALEGVDAVVNAAGVLQNGSRDNLSAVQEDAPAALFAACAEAGVRRIVHISAIGADSPRSDFSRSKLAAEQHLVASGLDWVILRPSVVVGRSAFGGSALFRGLAALPVLPVLGKAGLIQPVQLDDVVETVAQLVKPDAPHGVVLELAGPAASSLEEIVARYRHWLGWPPARGIALPGVLWAALYKMGDLAGWLGWRPPIRTTAHREMVRGATGDPAPWTRLTGIAPLSLEQALAAEPASVQERWFARLYLLKPLVLFVFACFWILTAFVSLGPGYDIGLGLMREGGAGPLSGPSVVAGALADLAIGIGILFRRTAKPALIAALLISLFYVVAGTWLLPRLWEDPLGPMMKIWPILALNLIALAILEDR